MLEHLIPGLGVLGLGGLLGYAVALAFREAARVLGCLLGVLFILLQVLAYYGIVHLDWGQILHHAEPATKMAGSALEKFWKIITYNLPFGGGFAGGFYLGFRQR